nr:Ig-like domain-containing protein [Rhodococcus opacus PD630]
MDSPGHPGSPRRAQRLRAALFTSGAAAAAVVLVAPHAAAVPTATTVAVQGTAATTCPVTLTAKVTPTPTGGTVEFRDGNTVIGAAAAVTADGTANVNHTFTTTDARVIPAKFNGAKDFDVSTSAALTVNVGMGLNLGSICLPIG